MRSDARPIAQSQPKKSPPHWMPPKRSRWRARIVSRADGGEDRLVVLDAVVDAVAVGVVDAGDGVVAVVDRGGGRSSSVSAAVVDERAAFGVVARGLLALLFVVVRGGGAGRGPRAADGDRAAAAAVWSSSCSSARSGRSATVVSSVRSVMAPVVSASSRARSSRAASRSSPVSVVAPPRAMRSCSKERSAARSASPPPAITSRSRSPGDWRSKRAVSTRSFDSSSSRSATVVSRSRVATEAASVSVLRDLRNRSNI